MILAKSQASGISLIEHTNAVIDAAKSLFGTLESPTRLAEAWRHFFRIQDFERFHSTLIASAGFHDLGKANDRFDAAVLRTGDQLIRHEHLSGLILCLEEIDEWVSRNSSIDRDVMLSATISHHLKVNEETFAQRLSQGNSFRLLIDDPDDEFTRILNLIAKTNGLKCPPTFPKWWSFDESGEVNIERVREDIIDNRLVPIEDWIDTRSSSDRHRLLQAVRSALIASDAVGSADPRLGTSVREFIETTIHQAPSLTASDVFEKVIDPRIRQLSKSASKDFRWNKFQVQCDDLPSRALLLAPCGSGKTLAAWRWIASQCQRGMEANRLVSRIIFLYPTRATATEGFRDYVSWAPDADAALVHGTAEYDLDGMFENPAETADERAEKRFEVEQRLFAIGFWTKRIFSATVDQFLGFMQHSYSATCVLPLLAESVVVVDEAHSFDEGMFSALRDFLKEFDGPVLCMTATLPEARVNLLREVGMQPNAEHPDELREIAAHPRYSVHEVASRIEAEHIVRRGLNDGKRVLWVVNQVRRAQEIVDLFCSRRTSLGMYVLDDTPLYCYHSRFRLKDRRDRHREVVAAIHIDCAPALAVTTQVCEMSLDLDADLMVTEHCPVTSLIQRMGRCNRSREPRASAGECIVYEADNHRPYDSGSLSGIDGFLKQLVDRRTSQLDLDVAMRRIPIPPDLPRQCGFLSSAPYAMSRDFSFRDIDAFTVPGLLEGDVEDFLSDSARATGFVVPVPKGLARREAITRSNLPSAIPKYLTVIPNEFYNEHVGLKDF